MKTQLNLSKTTGIICKATCLLSLIIFCFINYVSAQSSGIMKIDTRLYNGNDIVDANVVVFDPSFSNAVGVEDAFKLSTSGENIAILRGTALLVVEGRQPATANDIIPFKIWNLRQQNYRLEIIASLFASLPLIPVLEDKYLHTTTAISRDAATNINFTVTSDPASSATDRFRIIFAAAAPLPVSFISFTAGKKSTGVDLLWKVNGQVNVHHYEVERSIDGKQFIATGSVAVVSNIGGDINYLFTDQYTGSAACFYRIKSVDNDGSAKYSSIIKVNAERALQGYTILSNPVVNNTINIQFSNQAAGVYYVALVNGEGKKIMSNRVNHTGGTANETVSVPGAVSTGIYWLQIITPGNKTESKMVVIGSR